MERKEIRFDPESLVASVESVGARVVAGKIPRALVLSVIPVLLAGCGVETKIENTWSPGHKAIAEKIYTGDWEFRSLTKGDGIVVRLYREDFITGSFDGLSHEEIVFVLPSSARAGDSFDLKPVPPDRPTRGKGLFDRLAPMEIGEITAAAFANPSSATMRLPKRATVRVRSLNQRKAVIQLDLKTHLEPGFDMDIDRSYTLKVGLPPQD